MQIKDIKDGEIYRNKRDHLVTLHGKHICYIDIPNEAVVYVRAESLKSDDWELFLPESQKIVSEPPKRRGRKPKNVQ